MKVREYRYSAAVYEQHWGLQRKKTVFFCGITFLCSIIVFIGGPLAFRKAWPYLVYCATGIFTLLCALVFAIMSCFRIAQRQMAERQAVIILADGTLLVRLVPKKGLDPAFPLRYIEEVLEYHSHYVKKLEINNRHAVVFGQFTFSRTVNGKIQNQKVVDCVKIPRVCGSEEELFDEISNMRGAI